MKVTMNDPILNVDGNEIKEGDKAIIFVDIIVSALVTAISSDQGESGEEMLKKWDLAQRAHKARGGTLDLTIDEGAFIKERIRKVFSSTVMYANAHRYFEAAAGQGKKSK